MKPKYIQEEIILRQKQENLKKSKDLASSFPNNPYIRIIIPNGGGAEIELTMDGLDFDEKVEKIYQCLNRYIDVK